MNIWQAVVKDLEAEPIWTWQKSQVTEKLSKFSLETKDYVLMQNTDIRAAYVEDLEEFFTEVDTRMIYNLILNQFDLRTKQIAAEDYRNQEIRAIELFPNVDINSHIGDIRISAKIPRTHSHYGIAKKAEEMTLNDWQKMAIEKNWRETVGDLKKTVINKIWEEYQTSTKEIRQSNDMEKFWREKERWRREQEIRDYEREIEMLRNKKTPW